MKPLRNLTLVLAVVAALAAVSPASAAVSFDFFHSHLSHHGSWLVSGSYGHVWRPAVYRAGWNPYYDGHWTYTDAGWCWDSDYAWGDIPYHYGTWVMDGGYGWVWVPGYTWAPSWVEFRQGPDYIGWAPVAPSFSIGVSFHAPFPVPSSFVFVHSHDFLCDHVRGYAVPQTQVNMVVNKTRIINNNIRIENNVVVNRGPDVRYVERATRRRVDAIPVARTRSVRELGARGVTGTDLRVNGRGRGLRAAEPVSANRHLPAAREGARGDRFSRRTPEQRSVPEQRSTPERHQTPERRAVPERRSMPEQRNAPESRRTPDRRAVPEPRSAPERQRTPERRAVPERRSMPEQSPRVRDHQRGAGAQARPDEGRLFRGVREPQPSRRADRPSRQGTSRPSGSDPKARRNPKDHKGNDDHKGHDGK